MTVGVHGILAPNPWLEGSGRHDFRESVLDLALIRAEAYGWHAPYGWRTPTGKKLFHVPDRWLDCDKGGDWAGGTQIRELAWMQADIPEDARHPRLPVLPLTRMLIDALHRVGSLTFTALQAYLPLQSAAGDASGDLDDMRDWFALAAPTAAVDVHVTVAAAPSVVWDSPEESARVRHAVQERLGTAAEVGAPSQGDTSRFAGRAKTRSPLEGARTVVHFLCRTREWTPDAAVWLVEVTGDALRSTGHTTPVVVTASSLHGLDDFHAP
ncbi:hypothetical protein [Streptomyces sp. 891-h]|uniref:hypothetical protein n=1 Tax=Streptomyces sp. 891-h TaxID=2720714 RepID=UPI001FA9DBB8|nr:hypothetical protein [Streptomyces sp. 891-h]UNZ15868.1 hypothetical protein HC362_00950 [Streptomyces sp. 891-h]